MVLDMVVWRALKLWWREWIGILFLNLLWVLLLLPLVTAPPATAVFFAVCKKMVDSDPWDLQDLLPLLRQLFFPAWKWALPNLLFVGVTAVNFIAYQSFDGLGWIVLRAFWGMLTFFWLLLNLFYWPFWLNQEEKGVYLTYSNAARFLLKQPGTAVLVTLLSITVVGASLQIVFPLTIGLIGWIMLLGLTAVQDSLSLQKKKSA